ncbi:MAG: M20 family metallopeptidase, partial [Solirubrobacterales bacterium]
MDELALTERLVAFDTSSSEGLRRAAEFVGGWLESRDIAARQVSARGLPVTMAEVGPADAPTLVMHGHLDVVPGERGQFQPELKGDRLYGRGAYDMKGALAVMMMVLHDAREQENVRLRLGIVSDEESEEDENRGSDRLVDDGFIGDFAITGEPTNLQVGVQAKGVLALRLRINGRAAHGSTPWLGDN